MRSHLQFRHPSVDLSHGGTQNKPSFGATCRQSTLAFSSKKTMTTQQYQRATRKLAVMCAVDVKPISLVEGPGFKYFCNELNPDYKMPCRKTVSKYLQKIYDEEKEELVGKLRGHSVAITSDLWTSNAMEGYLGLTGHYISDEWELKAKVLATRKMKNRHTGDNIAREIKALMDEFQIVSCAALTTDNASNMSVAAGILDYRHVGCFAHTLQLAIEDGLKVAQISKTLSVSRQLVGHFNHSVIATDGLLSKQEGPQKLKLIQDVQTRWNSSFLMLQRLLKLRVPIYGVLFDDKLTKVGDRAKLDMKDCYWKVIEDILPILEPLAEITEVLGKENEPTGSSVYVLIKNVFTHVLCSELGDSCVLKELKLKIKEGLQKRFKVDHNGDPEDNVLNSPLLMASLLDPRYKSLIGRDVLSQEQRDVLHKSLIASVGTLASCQSVKVEEEDNHPPTKKCKILDALKGDVIDLSKDCSDSSVEFELECYLKESVTVSEPLMWWKLCASKFPRIAKVAKVFLAIPATSISSERTFSVAGLTVNSLRSSLDPDTVDQIVFVNKNLKPSIKAFIESNFQISGPNDKTEPTTENELIPEDVELEVSGEINVKDLPTEVKTEIFK